MISGFSRVIFYFGIPIRELEDIFLQYKTNIQVTLTVSIQKHYVSRKVNVGGDRPSDLWTLFGFICPHSLIIFTKQNFNLWLVLHLIFTKFQHYVLKDILQSACLIDWVKQMVSMLIIIWSQIKGWDGRKGGQTVSAFIYAALDVYHLKSV